MNICKERSDAKETGAMRYFTGKPCRNGHVSERWTSTAICVACNKLIHKPNMSAEQKEKDRIRSLNYGRKHMAKATAKVKQWRIDNPGARDVWDADYRSRKRQQCRDANTRWREKRPDYFKEYQQKNIERFRAHRRNRKARVKAAPGSHTAQDVAELLKAQRGRCGYCRVSLGAGYHVDHIIPIKRGGSNYRHNLQLLCEPCNLSKGAKDPLDFARQVGRLL